MDENLKQAKAEFVTERINYHGMNENQAVSDAVQHLRAAFDEIRTALPDEYIPKLRACENAYSSMEGELIRFYYTGGFSDAIDFLSTWKEPL